MHFGFAYLSLPSEVLELIVTVVVAKIARPLRAGSRSNKLATAGNPIL